MAAIVIATPVHAADKVGEAVNITTQVRGAAGNLAKGDDIHRDETIRTNVSGVGAFRFEDGTKLAVGPNSSVVIDDYVYGGGNTVKKLALGATKGTLRWISGKSDHSAYQIKTPSGTLGVRGTAFDVYIGRNGITAVTLLNGSAQFCGAKGCQTLNRRCDYIIARPGGEVTKPRGIARNIGLPVTGSQAFPFLSGNASLPRSFKIGSSCSGFAALTPENKGGSEPPSKPEPPDRNPDK